MTRIPRAPRPTMDQAGILNGWLERDICVSNGTMQGIADAWGVNLAEAVRSSIRQFFWMAVIDARLANLRKPTPERENQAADRKNQKRLQTKCAKLADKQIILLRLMQRVGPWDTRIGLQFDISACIDILHKLSNTARDFATKTRPKRPRPGRPREKWLDDLILALAKVCEEAGGTPSAGWNNYVDDPRVTRFVDGISTLLSDLPPDIPVSSATALGERVYELRAQIKSRAKT